MWPESLSDFLSSAGKWSNEAYRILGLGDVGTWGLKLFCGGVAFIVLGAFWLLARSFRTRVWWGLCVLSVVLSPIFILFRWKRARPPVLVMLLGACTLAGAHVLEEFLVNQQLGARIKDVDGELHITLTGWKETGYSMLAARPEATVVQMANPDVVDGDLLYLVGMERLRLLDLSGTEVTDAGLATIAELRNLKSLRLARTKITDAGFRKHLFDSAELRELDLTGTKVTSATAREWKDRKPDRKRPLQ